MLANPAIKGQMDRPQGGRSIPPSERGRSTAFAPALRRGKCCRVGVLRSALGFVDHRGPEVTPTPPPPTKSGVADLPLSVSGDAANGIYSPYPTMCCKIPFYSARSQV